MYYRLSVIVRDGNRQKGELEKVLVCVGERERVSEIVGDGNRQEGKRRMC